MSDEQQQLATAEPGNPTTSATGLGSIAAPRQSERAPIALAERGIQLRSFDELARFSVAIAKSRLAPKGFETPEAIMVAIQLGMEIGLGPMSALQNTCVINGRPALYGDAPLGIVRSTGRLEEFEEWYERDGKRVENLS